MPDKTTATLVEAFERALGAILARVSASADVKPVTVLAVAYSGGLDSSALLHLAHAYANTHGLRLFAFHVHHGLSPNANAWLTHCEQESARLGVGFEAQRVNLANEAGEGTEQAARKSRYAALGELCRKHGVPLLLTAHHQDDQAETVLLQLLRGAGVAGLGAMKPLTTAPDLVGDPALLIARPLLEVTRKQLECFVDRHGISHVEDESNTDVRYARNALRHAVMPVLANFFPGFEQCLARSAQHAQSAQSLLDQLAEKDLAECGEGDSVEIGRIRHLDSARIDNLLRYWLSLRGVRMPSAARLKELRVQLLGASEDAQLCVTHGEWELRRHRDRIYITPRSANPSKAMPVAFRWRGEVQMHFPDFRGTLHFDHVKVGVDAEWLRMQQLVLRHRSGGEMLKAAPNSPTRSLKHHYQALNVPAWERLSLPVITTRDHLLFAAGIGMNWREFPASAEGGILLRWERTPV